MIEYTVVELMVAGLVGNVVALFVLWGGLLLEVGYLNQRIDLGRWEELRDTGPL